MASHKSVFYDRLIAGLDRGGDSTVYEPIVVIAREKKQWQVKLALKDFLFRLSENEVMDYVNILAPALSLAERRMIKTISDRNFNSVLNKSVNYIFNTDGLPLYLQQNDHREFLKKKVTGELIIRFKPVKIIRRKALFSPRLIFKFKHDKAIETGPGEHLIMDNHFYALVPYYHALITLKKVPGLAGLINPFRMEDALFTPDDIAGMKKLPVLTQTDRIHIDFPYENIDIQKSGESPVLEIKEYPDGITIKVLFEYKGKTFPFDPEHLLYETGISGTTLSLLEREPPAQRKYFQYVKNRFSKIIVRENMSPAGSYNFSVKCSMNRFVIEHAEYLLAEGFEIRRKGEKLNITISKGLSFRAKSKNDWLDLQAGIIDQDGKFSKASFEKELIGNRLIKNRKGYFLITRKDIEQIRSLYIMGMEENGMLKLSRQNFYFLEEFYEQITNKKNREINQMKKAAEHLKNFSGIKEAAPPSGFCGRLREYQKGGLSWLYFLSQNNLNGCLADDMGLGKTVQTLAFLGKIKEEKKAIKALILLPVSTIANWEEEIKKFTPHLKTVRHHGSSRKTDIGEYGRPDIILTTYHTLRNDIQLFLKHSFSHLILDEAQAIKNSTSKIFKCVRMLEADYKLSVSGTPIENNTLELWSQMDFLMPGLLGTKKSFIERFAKPIEEKGSKQEAEMLRRIIFPFILRRKKEEVAKDLPEKEEIKLFVEMESEQRQVYEEVKALCREKVLNTIEDTGIGKSSITILAALLKLRQIALFPSLADERYAGIPSCKMEILKNLVEDVVAENHKVLIFSQFVKSLSLIRSYVESRGIKYSYLDGGTKDRKEEIRRFQEDEESPLFLISLKAGGVGINLTRADYVILFDPWWNPAVEKQAVDRAHRIGRKNKVIAYKLIVKDTVEEKILRLQEKKLRLVEDIITEEKAFFKSLQKEDVVSLFE